MLNIKPELKKILKESFGGHHNYQRNLLRQHLQLVILDYLYSHPKYQILIFYGGSCLAQCYNLPRLSEDLDFIDKTKKMKLSVLAEELQNYFDTKTDLSVKVKVQKFRLYLKFAILHELKLATPSESDLLFLKIEIFPNLQFKTKQDEQIISIYKQNKVILIRTLNLQTLMASKIGAILNRQWVKTDKTGKTIINTKGRDYFDLQWYLQKNIHPNLKWLPEINNIQELKKMLLKKINKLDEKDIQLDLEGFISDKKLVKNLSINLKKMLINGIDNLV